MMTDALLQITFEANVFFKILLTSRRLATAFCIYT